MIFQHLPDDLEPHEIVAELHRYMAALHPRLAALVAFYDDVQAGRRERVRQVKPVLGTIVLRLPPELESYR